jgi:hypothetical protein
MKRGSAWWLLVLGLLSGGTLLAVDLCAVCGREVEGTAYLWNDKITGGKKLLCDKCTHLPKNCYRCGLPVLKEYTELPDGRVLCARDARTVVRAEDEAFQICREVKDALDRLFSRFLTIPDTNVTLALADRVNLMQLFATPGNDYTCPNVLGYLRDRTNSGHVTHEISLLSGLPRTTLKAVCAHEYTHAWLSEQISHERRQTLSRDAEEGLCELVSYRLMEAQGEEEEKRLIKTNAYTRGQIHLFVEAERRFGFNEVIEWMKYGEDGRLMADDLTRVRRVTLPAATNRGAPSWLAAPAGPPPAPETLILNGILWSKTRPVALINGQVFEAQTQARVRLGKTNVTVRCLAIREDSVVIQCAESGQAQTLRLKGP